MAAVNPAEKLPILPPAPVAPPKAAQVSPPAVKVAKVAPPEPKFKLDQDKGFLPSPPSIGEKARAALGKAEAPRPRINIVG